MATIIVPAHNESAVIADCLDSIVGQAGVDHVIVACNGCTDNTAQIVRDQFPDVHLLDIEEPSKPNAMNKAEEKAKSLGTTYPIYFIDADTRLGKNAVAIINEALASGPYLLAAPTPVHDISRSSWLVRQFYRIWVSLPYNREGVIATCSFILSEEGRRRFGEFVEVLSDDGYVRGHFKTSELCNVPGAEIYISAPRDILSVIKIKSRHRLSNIELRTRQLCPVIHEKKHPQVFIRRLLSRDFLATSVYLFVTVIVRLRAQLLLKRGDYTWTRDVSTRGAG